MELLILKLCYNTLWIFKEDMIFQMRVRTTNLQKPPEHFQAEIECFLMCVKQISIKNDYTDFNISIMIQKMCHFDVPPNSTNNLKEEIWIRISNIACTKKGFTVALYAWASAHKLPVISVLKQPSSEIPAKAMSKLIVPENVWVEKPQQMNSW